MIKFLQNIGDYFSSNYFDEDFAKKVLDKSGYAAEDLKIFNKQISALKDKYYRFKLNFLEGKLRIKDKVTETHHFHTEVLNALGYPGSMPEYKDLLHIDESTVLPVRHVLYRGKQPHLMIMEMQALLKDGDDEPDGLFEQRYSTDDEETQTPPQKYHRSQWIEVFKVPDGLKISPMVINKAVSELFLLPLHRRPKYILLCAGNQYFLLEQEKWFRGSYLQFNLEDLFDEASVKRDYYSLFYFLLAKEALAPQSDIVLMDQLDEDSHKSAYEVTRDLKEGVIHAVESIANEAVYFLTNKGLELNTIDANGLKDDCLTMVYRLLFLFYAESRDDLDILPSNDAIYEQGYSLEMLRDLEQVPLNTASSQNGYFFHESLYRLFSLLNKGHRENQPETKSFKIRHLDSPLFDDATLNYLPGVKLRNSVWQDVICQLSLSRKQKNKARGRISYANLGINQLGSVYESLLAFRGFLADTDYIEVHRKRKANESSEKVVNADGSYLVPRHRLDDFDLKEVYYEANDELRIIKKGTFVYRLSGRDRQNSASYYTPEVLTQCTVKYTLKPILERLDKGEMKALDLLELKILEPAMGAAAFHNEVINQLAETYLVYRQQETGRKVAPDKYREETQKVKAYIALNNVYGVDLNPTAVELGKLSLWLNVIHKDMQTPFFGYRLGVGNAVVGAWLKVYKHKDFSFEPVKPQSQTGIKKEWWEKAPKHLKFGSAKIQRAKDEIYHFLLPDKNMLASAGIKLLKQEFAEEAARVTAWRKDFCAPIKGYEYQKLQKIASAIDELLELHYQFQSSVNIETRIKGDFFGAYESQEQIKLEAKSYQEKAKLAAERSKTNAPYYKLKLIMDYWCSFWFWDVRNAKDLPSRQEWYEDLEKILNIDLEAREASEDNASDEGEPIFAQPAVQGTLFGGAQQLTLKSYKKEKNFAQTSINKALSEQPSSLFANRRSEIVMDLASQYRFFHYQLEFIEVFRERNGFDVAVGNPPWLVIAYDRIGMLSDSDPLHIIKESDTSVVDRYIEVLTAKDDIFRNARIEHLLYVEASKAFFNGKTNYTLLNGQKPNLHKLIIENILKSSDYIGMVHDKGIYDDSSGQLLRHTLYGRMNFYFQFQNELGLFSEVGNTKKFELSICGPKKDKIDFYTINNLFHPSTVDQSFVDTNKDLIGIRTNLGKWDIRGNTTRVIRVTEEELKFYKSILQDDSKWDQAKLPVIHSNLLLSSLKKLHDSPEKLVNEKENLVSTIMLDETKGKRLNIIEEKAGFVQDSEFVLAAIHYYNGNPIFQTPNENCANHRDNSRVDLLTINDDFLPRTVYRLKKDGKQINSDPNYYYAQRKRAQISNEKTLITSIQPPHRVHTDNTYSIHFKDQFKMLTFSCYSFSIVYDFYVKSTGRENIYFDTVCNLPLKNNPSPYILARGLYLTCITSNYENLWNTYSGLLPDFDSWSRKDELLEKFKFSKPLTPWNFKIPLKSEYHRRQALIEIDVLVCMDLGLSLEQLLTIYSIVFGVLQSNEESLIFDGNGRVVSSSVKRIIATNETKEIEDNGVLYIAPFREVNRVEDYKLAWQHFEQVFND